MSLIATPRRDSSRAPPSARPAALRPGGAYAAVSAPLGGRSPAAWWPQARGRAGWAGAGEADRWGCRGERSGKARRARARRGSCPEEALLAALRPALARSPSGQGPPSRLDRRHGAGVPASVSPLNPDAEAIRRRHARGARSRKWPCFSSQPNGRGRGGRWSPRMRGSLVRGPNRRPFRGDG